MRISNSSLCALLLSSLTGLSVAAFAPPSRNFAPSRILEQRTISNQYPNPTISFAKPNADSEEQEEEQEQNKPRSALDLNGVDEVAAEAEAALKEAKKALDMLQGNDTNTSTGTDNAATTDQLIDVDEEEDSSETQSILQKLASGKLSSGDVTTKLLKKQNDIQDQKRKETRAREEESRRVEASRLQQQLQKLKSEAVSASIGGAAFGAIAGAALDVYLDMNGMTEVQPIIPPLALGVSLGAAAFGVGQQDSKLGEVVRGVFGGAVVSVSDAVSSAFTSAVDSAVENVKAAPTKFKTAVDAKVKSTTDEIRQIPSKVQTAASERAEGISKEIRQIPDKVRNSAAKSAENTKKGIETATKKAVEDVKAAPGRVAESTKKAVAKTVEDVEEQIERTIKDTEKKITDTVEEVVSLPGKTLDKISDKVSKVIPMDKNETKPNLQADMIPKPPQMPPPASLLKELEKERVAKPPPAKINFPSVPKINLPNPMAASEKKAEDEIVFNEVSLNNLVSSQEQKDTRADEDSDRPNIFDLKARKDNKDEQKSVKLAAAMKKKEAAEERKMKAEERRQTQLDAAAAKKGLTDEKKAQAEKVRLEAQEKKAAQVRLQKARPGATISLGFFGFGEQKKEDDDGNDVQPSSGAPKGVPTMSKWRQNRDGSITGLISGSSAFSSGESITTSPITTKEPSMSTVVTTVSGSRYYLDESTASSSGGFFGFGAPTPKPPSSKMESKENNISDAVKVAEERKLAALAAAEARKEQAEERRAAADAKRREAEEKRQASIAARKEAGVKRQAEKLLSNSSGGTLSLGGNNQKTQQAQKAEKVITAAKPGATISLGFFNFGQNQEQSSATKAVSTSAPSGTSILTKWRQNRDGSISGFISKSKAFKEGESITTSPLKTKSPTGESIVTTISGSKYFLDAIGSKPGLFGSLQAKSSVAAPKPAAVRTDTKVKMQQLADERKTAAEARKKEAQEKRKSALDAAESRKKEAQEKRNAGRESAQKAKRKEQAKKAAATAVAKAKPKATISLGFLNFGQSDENTFDAAPIIVSSAPRGVPTLSKWRQNRDGSITGLVSGSNAYKDNESITTSPTSNKPADNAVVRTTSGTKYFLVSNNAPTVPKRAPAKTVAPKKPSIPKARKSVQAVEKAKSGATISLGFLNFGSDDKGEQNPIVKSATNTQSAPQIVSQAPRGVPTLSNWRQNRDSSISGMISGSNAYKEGETVTTSPITSNAADGAIVKTTSGSKYFLEPKAQFGGFFGAKTQNAQTSKTSASDSSKKQAEERKATAEARKREGEEKRKAALKAAEGRKSEAEEKRKAARVSAEKRKKEAEEKRQAALAAAEAKKREVAEKRQAATQALKSKEVVGESTPRATISLGFLNFGQTEDTSSAPSSAAAKDKKPPSKMASAPRGVPTLYSWRQNRDGSITGFISGSKSYSDGESVTTSPLSSDTAFGALVQTATGSKYYLAAKGANQTKAPAPAAESRRSFSLFKGASPPETSSESAVRTFSLGKPLLSEKAAPPPSASKPKAKKPAPRGIPKLAKWRKNRDSTITGIISGSPSYDEGDRVTTSSIVSGTIGSGEVVQTGSGSKYYLD